MKKIPLLAIGLMLILNACKKQDEKALPAEAPNISNHLNQFKDLRVPQTAISRSESNQSTTLSGSANDNNGCVPIAHTQSAEFDKLSVLDPSTDIMYIGSLLDGNSIQSGTYDPLIYPAGYVRKPITYSVSIQGSSGPIAKTITPTLADFRTSMQEIMRSTITGQQPANFTFSLINTRSKREMEMKISANLKFSTFFNATMNYDESSYSGRNFFVLKIFQKFFSADINIPGDGNLFNKPIDFTGTIAPVYISTIDYGRSAYLLLETTYDSSRVYKSLEASFSAWIAGGGTTISNEYKVVMDELKISGVLIGGSSTSAATTIQGIQAFRDYVINSANMGPESRGEVIAYKLRNAKNHGVYKTIINGDYTTMDCSSQLVNIQSYSTSGGGNSYLAAGFIPTGNYWHYDGPLFRAYNKPLPGAVPINSFNSAPGEDHYFTPNWIDAPGWWQYEGVAFYAYKTQVPGSIPIHIHYCDWNMHHYFGPQRTLDDPNYWKFYEGISFYAFPL
ncbi:thiol-activated cytolysin family protein [Chitinophaga nivalis]|uniref:Thiol-activated cytolysin family protein n=1 Tax=Chitinophaga nivalis TaxID=2991709 RepID=A0ABT3IMU3_9BACT|nr:thiol-activated cytolysin family protein [Chitinophaga nivalis]MCW3465009.1 thiol-activated cytolysin family protein [Chitinophaga nivalis]MCW3485299.1 thiol-activated cytolysin family protein [Chitinophaga nivalis]